IRRTLASPIFAISSNNPSAIFAEALSASIRTARRGERASEGTITSPDKMQCGGSGQQTTHAKSRVALIVAELSSACPRPRDHLDALGLTRGLIRPGAAAHRRARPW